MSYLRYMFTLFGLFSALILGIGVWLDVADFDNTKGGYSAPYDDYTGEPVDWSELDRTPTGLVKHGHVINVHVNGTTGMISFEIFRRVIRFRPFSDRALAVHKPREAFIAMGFKPEF